MQNLQDFLWVTTEKMTTFFFGGEVGGKAWPRTCCLVPLNIHKIMKTFYTWPCLLDLVYIHALTRESFTLIGWEITITQNNPFFPLQTSLWPWKEFTVNKTSTNSKPQYHFSSKYTRSNFSSLTCPRRHISTSFPFISCDRLRGVIRLCEHGPAKTKGHLHFTHYTVNNSIINC